MSLRDAFDRREPIAGNWSSFTDPAIGELSAQLGFDFVVVDAEHTSASLEQVAHVVRGIDSAEGETAVVVRVPDDDPTYLKRVLDLGVDGVMVPMVETTEQAEAIVEATRYPPEGIRGVGAGRATRFGLDLSPDDLAAAEPPVVIPQIESERAVEEAPELAAVDGIDALFVGPIDLSKALGVFGEWEGDTFREAVSAVIDAAHDADIAAGTLATDDKWIRHWVDYGYDFAVIGFDVSYVTTGSQRALEVYEQALDERETSD